MPKQSVTYNGIDDKRKLHVRDDPNGKAHVFALGDWGAQLPGHDTCSAYGDEVDTQFHVADQMKDRAKKVWGPDYILNAGDNFYMAGMQGNCNEPPSSAYGEGKREFDAGWGWIYGSLSDVPWLSALGNHDYGGWHFAANWPAQIGYSFINDNWVMPAHYFSKYVKHSDFEVEYFITDTNAFDAHHPSVDQDHNICSFHNAAGASCAANGGMSSIWDCEQWFKNHWNKQTDWLKKRMSESRADWQVIVTHFPCESGRDLYMELREQYGLDLLVTGHRHQQELWHQDSPNQFIKSHVEGNRWNDLVCFVTGGGGGKASEKYPGLNMDWDMAWYGFFDLTFTRRKLRVQLIDSWGQKKGDVMVKPFVGKAKLAQHRELMHSSRRRGYLPCSSPLRARRRKRYGQTGDGDSGGCDGRHRHMDMQKAEHEQKLHEPDPPQKAQGAPADEPQRPNEATAEQPREPQQAQRAPADEPQKPDEPDQPQKARAAPPDEPQRPPEAPAEQPREPQEAQKFWFR